MAELPLAQAASSADSASLAQSVSSQHPFGNGFYHLFMVIWGMVYYCFTMFTTFFVPTLLQNGSVYW
jgi:hypothetical protein